MSADPVQRITALLEHKEPRKRIAAAMVLGELGTKDAAAVAGLCKLAADPIDACAGAAVEALGLIGSAKSLPALLAALERGGELERFAAAAIAHLGAGALPALQAHLTGATPRVRAAVAQILPAIGGRRSLQMTLESLREQSVDAANRVALAVRHEVKAASPAERRTTRTLVMKFLDQKRTQKDEGAARAAVKILGYLELPETVETLLAYLAPRQPPAVRIEAATALRFAMGAAAPKKAVKRLVQLLEDEDPAVVRAARDTLASTPLDADLAGELAHLCQARDPELAVWAIGRLASVGGKAAASALSGVARVADRARAQAAARALASMPHGAELLAAALAGAGEEAGALALAEALVPLAGQLGKPEAAALRAAGSKALAASLTLGLAKLEPVRAADAATWADAVRKAAMQLAKKRPDRAKTLYAALARGQHATPADRYALAALELSRSSLDARPQARAQDTALQAMERLARDGFPLAATLARDRAIPESARYYVGFHLVEGPQAGEGMAILEAVAKGKSKLAKAAKNKLKLLDE